MLDRYDVSKISVAGEQQKIVFNDGTEKIVDVEDGEDIETMLARICG